MRLHSITTCHTDDNVTGIQFFMALDPYEVDDDELFELTAIGKMAGACSTIELPDGLDKIKADRDRAKYGLAIIYKINGDVLKEQYGEKNWAWTTEWEFDDAHPLVGLYGRQNENGIEQLGFITLNTQCQADTEEVDENDGTDTTGTDTTTDGTDTTTDGTHDFTDVAEVDTTPGNSGALQTGLQAMTLALIVAATSM